MTAAETPPRTETRFEPQATVSPGLFLLVLNAGALAAGAGAVGFFLRMRDANVAPYTTEVLAFAALLMGVATFLAAARGTPIRVGPAGIAFEKDELVRVPWYGVESITLEGDAIRVRGKSVYGAPINELCRIQVHQAALAALLAEVAVRIPSVSSADVASRVGAPVAGAGSVLALEAVHVTGRRCAATNKPIAFEADGVVCPRCERVYSRVAIASGCACGAPLS